MAISLALRRKKSAWNNYKENRKNREIYNELNINPCFLSRLRS